MKITVEVTLADIYRAIIDNSLNITRISEHCPVAQALKRQFPCKHILASFCSVFIDDTRYWACYPDNAIMSSFTQVSRLVWTSCKPAKFQLTDEVALSNETSS